MYSRQAPLLATIAIAISLPLAACSGPRAVLPPPVATAVSEVQGAGEESPLKGRTVRVAGVVTGDYQDGDADAQRNLGGFFIQDSRPDDNTATSDGVFVFERSGPIVGVNVGDEVSVAGEVIEFSGETQIVAGSVTVTGNAAVRPVDVSLPLPTTINGDGEPIADLERYEGMLVRVPQTLTVIDLFGLERFGEVLLASGGRQFQFTNTDLPDVAGFASHRLQLAGTRLILDDGMSTQFARPIRYLFPTPGESLRIGDTVTNLSANVRYSRGSGSSGVEAFRLLPAAPPQFAATGSRDAIPPDVGGGLKIASFNVLNFFTTIDTGQDVCGPAGDDRCRGADSAAEFDRQRQKIVTALTLIDADIVGLVELENNATAAIGSIVDGLNAMTPAGRWSFIDSGTIGSDTIRVGLIFKEESVSPVGRFAVLDAGVDARFRDDRNRPVLLQTFSQRSNGAVVNVAVSHLKSKGSACGDIDDPDRFDGQGNCNLTRTAAAAAVADWLRSDPTASGDADILLLGDLNAYLKEDPLDRLRDAGFQNLLDSVAGDTAYSFQFRGESGALDHALASQSLLSQVTGVAEWHINADEPAVLDYNLESGRYAALFDPAVPARASDHDPVIVGLSLTANEGLQENNR